MFKPFATRSLVIEVECAICIGKEEQHDNWKQRNGTMWLNKRNEKHFLGPRAPTLFYVLATFSIT